MTNPFDPFVFRASHDGEMPTLMSNGLGADSAWILTLICDDPAGFGLRDDLSDFILVTAVTGDEFDDSLRMFERHLLPRMAARRARYVQLARAGQSDTAGVDVLDDTTSTAGMIKRGQWALSDEMARAGTLPQFAGDHICSIRAKGQPIDAWAKNMFRGMPYRHIIGYHAGEPRRKAKDKVIRRPGLDRHPWYPLIDRGLDRDTIEANLLGRYGEPWPKSHCVMCPFPGVATSLPVYLERLRRHPADAVRVLVMERVAMSLNPRTHLFRQGPLLLEIHRDRNIEAIVGFEQHLDTCEWAVYEVRRVVLPNKRDPKRRGRTARSVRVLFTGTRSTATDHLASLADQGTWELDPFSVTSRLVLANRQPDVLPTYEHHLVAAPAIAVEKEPADFAKVWSARSIVQGGLDLF